MEHPLLKLPSPTPSDLNTARRHFGDDLRKPSRERQVERFETLFGKLTKAIDNRDELTVLRNDPTSIAPERAIVFEVAGSLKDFYRQAKKLGLEYLGDFEDEIDPTSDFHRDTEEKRKGKINVRVYLAMPNEQSLKELLKLWGLFSRNEKLPHGLGEWNKLFDLLVELRAWGPLDRVPLETISFWENELQRNPERDIRFEVELWYYGDRKRREQSFRSMEEKVLAVGGKIVHHAVIEEIHYDAALIDVPPDHVQELINHPGITLALADEIMFLRPQSVVHVPAGDGDEDEEAEEEEGSAPVKPQEASQQKPIAALLDGLPVQNHARLAGRLVIDDPNNLEPLYSVENRIHGTEMSSLIIHGDLNREEPPIPRPLFVLPIMQPDSRGNEALLPNKLFVDIVYQAVRRIKEGDGNQPASAPEVILINLSVGDRTRPFMGVISPLARLIDYLAYRYRIQFLISAGNVLDCLVIPGLRTMKELEDSSPDDRETFILNSVNNAKAHRTLLSPAEAINALTIGAANSGSAFTGHLPQDLIDPFTDEELPNIVSAMGLGYHKTVKPDLLMEGGRTPVRFSEHVDKDSIAVRPARGPEKFFGTKVASPGKGGDNRAEKFSHGTSVATALSTRAAHRIYDVLFSENGNSNFMDIPQEHMALAIRCLLIHGTGWSSKGSDFDSTFKPQGQGKHVQRRDNIARLLGYGVPRIDRVLICAENRATLLGWGTIDPESALLYRIPLPDLGEDQGPRAFTVTLAWFSPINMKHQGYRMAALDVESADNEKYWPVPKRRTAQPSNMSTRRGTILHEHRYGKKFIGLIDEDALSLKISCRARAGKFDESIPYAMAVSFEVEIESDIQVYEQIRSRLAAQIQPSDETEI